MIQQVTLPDGRTLDYQVSGASDGFTLFFIHGTPGSLVPRASFSKTCDKKGLKCITMSRAGYGGSTRKIGRAVIDCVADIEALKNHLKIQECFVAGWSGGGPHALACAARLPGCLAAIVIAGCTPHDLYVAEGLDWVEGQGEDNIEEYHATLKGEAALQEFVKPIRVAMLEGGPEGVAKALESLLPEADKKAFLNDPDMGQNISDSFQEGLKHNADGWVDDSLSFVKPWGFDLAEVQVPVFLWQGSEDLMVPLSQGKWFATHLPQDKVVPHLLEGEGHISIFLGRGDEMLDELLSVRHK